MAVTRRVGRPDRPDSIAGLWARAAHDLRQPVQAALLLASTLDGASERTGVRRAAQGIGAALASLYEMLEVLTLLARVEAGTQIVELRTCRLADDLEPAFRDFAEIAAMRGTQLRVRRLQGKVRSNPKLLATAARSLLLNAMRFGNGGDIVVGCRRDEDGVALEVQFSSASPGSAIEKHAFVQLPPAGEDLVGALGLGLALLRPLCRPLGHGLRHTVLGADRQCLALSLPVPGGAGPPISR